MARLWRWYAPAVPRAIRDPLRAAQIDNVRSQAPMLLTVAAVNVIIIMAVCWHNGLPLISYGWMSMLIVYCVVRISIWRSLLSKPISPAKAPSILTINSGLSLAMVSGLSIAASITYILGTFNRETLIPISLGFGATAIAHCFYTLRPAAIGALVLGITPVVLALAIFGDFSARMLAASMFSVEVLMIRFVAAQYDRLISGLFLEQQIRELADSDPLTGLPNRRAIMAAIETEVERFHERNMRFGVALLDLDGFKAVNDRLGHQAGDLMLLGVGNRLTKAARTGDRVGRLGGDEFIILFRNVGDKADLATRSTSMLAALCRPIDLDGNQAPVAASLGFALYPEDGDSIREVMHAADLALYSEKRAGKFPKKSQPKRLSTAA